MNKANNLGKWARKGWKHTKEWKKKQSEIKKKLGTRPPSPRGRKMSKETRVKISKFHKGKKLSLEHIEKLRISHLGHRPSIETRQRMREAELKRIKEGRHNNYRGGIESLNSRIRGSLEYKLWREAVYHRDNYTCIWCKKRGGRLNADHIKSFACFPELRFAIDNGRTLCIDCHKTTETYLKRMPKFQKVI